MSSDLLLEQSARALAVAHGNWPEAERQLLAWARRRKGLRDELLAIGATHAVRSAFEADRRTVESGKGQSVVVREEQRRAIPTTSRTVEQKPLGIRSVQAMATYGYTGLLGTPIADGLLLADARRPEVLEAAQGRAASAIGHALRARWLHLVVGRLPDDQAVVGQVLDGRQLERLEELAVQQVEGRLRGLLPRAEDS